MSDVEFQAASLSVREWALWVAIAQVTISAIQTGIVYYGIRAMIRATDQRGRDAERDREERAEAAAAARREADQRHAEAMKAGAERHAEAIAASAERHAEAMKAGAERHAEAMKAGAERHAENMAALKALIDGQARANATLAANTATLAEATAALKLVVERTAPGADRQPG